jgi:putative two-component system response regulator
MYPDGFTPPPVPTTGTILVVDDDDGLRRLLERMLSADGHVVVTVNDGEEALATVRGALPDIVVMDVRMPRLNGFETCRELKADPSTRLIPVVLMTGMDDREDRMRAIEAGADDFLRKPIDIPELRARARSLIRLKRYTDELDSAEEVILSLALTVEARDPSTDGHCQRLSSYGVAVGRRLGLSDAELLALHRGGYLHDIGKVAIPDSILLKSGPLTREEQLLMREHPVVGDRLCGRLRVLSQVRPIVRHHHERWDGSGYPDGLRGDAIPLLAQVVAVVDVYDALTTHRSYKPAWPVERALAELRRQSQCGLWRPDLVSVLIAASAAGELDAIDLSLPAMRGADVHLADHVAVGDGRTRAPQVISRPSRVMR